MADWWHCDGPGCDATVKSKGRDTHWFEVNVHQDKVHQVTASKKVMSLDEDLHFHSWACIQRWFGENEGVSL